MVDFDEFVDFLFVGGLSPVVCSEKSPTESASLNATLNATLTSKGLPSVKAVFNSFAEKDHTMNSKAFAKLCTKCGLIDSSFTINDSDLVFTKVVKRGERK